MTKTERRKRKHTTALRKARKEAAMERERSRYMAEATSRMIHNFEEQIGMATTKLEILELLFERLIIEAGEAEFSTEDMQEKIAEYDICYEVDEEAHKARVSARKK